MASHISEKNKMAVLVFEAEILFFDLKEPLIVGSLIDIKVWAIEGIVGGWTIFF
jgi:hypothetical protein